MPKLTGAVEAEEENDLGDQAAPKAYASVLETGMADQAAV